MQKEIYIVEDHAVMREMLQDFLAMSPDLSIAGATSSAESALEAIEETAIDLLLIDLSLPEMSGIDMAEEVTRRWPDLHCLMFSAHDEASYARRSLAAGARGYVIKGDPDELLEAIDTVLSGEIYLSTPLQGNVVDQRKDI